VAKRGPSDPSDDDKRIWARVSGTVTPPARRKAARVTPGAIMPELNTRPDPEPVVRGMAGKTRNKAKPRIIPKNPTTAEANAFGLFLMGLSKAEDQASARPRAAPEALEPRRQRRLSRERDPIEGKIDLHGFGRFEAEDELKGFLHRCQMRGMRSVLVITGQGRRGGGVIRASIHDWLTSPAMRGVVSGYAPAHRRHGGDGALYVTLKPR
jgi:DNA-nicking Smr family endonuclease